MRNSTLLLVAACMVLAAATPPASAVDQPITGAKLYIKSVGGGQQLIFTSKDPAALFAGAGSSDDPALAGALVEILSTVEPTASFSLPGGVGKPGWDGHAAVTRRHQFANALAPGGISPVKKLVQKQGKTLQVIAKAPGLMLGTATTRVAIRITTGTLRSCAVFDSSSFRKNEPGKLIAIKAPLPFNPDCTDGSLLGVNSGCGTSAPTCDGECPSGEECASFGFAPPNNHCGCLPIGSTPCGEPGIPTCGGSCPGGAVCGAVFAQTTPGGEYACDCAISCGNGFVYGGAPAEGVPFGCYPNLCSGTYPTCGGPCGAGGTCSPFNAASGSFTGCICATPAVCNAGGFECAPGEVCYINGPSAGCNPP